MFIAFMVRPHGSHDKGLRTAPPERRELLTRSTLDRAIEVSRRDTGEIDSRRTSRETSVRKRNYATDIAVYVFKRDKEQRTPSLRTEWSGKEKPLGLPPGTKIPALLSNRVFSFNVASPVLAIVPKDVSWMDEVVIPKDSRFLGEASVLKSLDRINVGFDLLIFPDGRQIRVRAMALSEDGSAGIKGKVAKHRDVKVLKAIGETLLGGASLFVGGARRDPYSLEDQMRLNLAQNLTNQAAQDLRSVRVDSSITVEVYTPIQVILLEAT